MAQLKPEQLNNHLSKNLAPIYIISGDETLLVQEYSDAIRAAAKARQFDNRELYHVEANFDWDRLHYASQSLGLFSEKKFIELRVTSKLSDKGRKALVEYCLQPPMDTLLLLILPKLEKRQLLAKWFTTLEKAGQFIQVWPISAQRLPRWIEQRAKSLGLDLNREAISLLASRVEGNLLAAAQELDKLKLLNIAGTIDAPTLADAVADSARYDVFSLVDRALAGDTTGASKILRGLKAEGTEIMALLWALAREIRHLLQLQHDTNNGKPFAAAARQLGIWDSRHPLLQSALRRLHGNQLQVLLRLAGQCDRTVKGLHPGDPWQTGLEIILLLSGAPSLDARTIRIALKG